MGSIDNFGFRNVTYPTFTYTPRNVGGHAPRDKNILLDNTKTLPTPDNRYPSYAAIMSDARYATDYRPKCSKNVAPGSQFAVHQWMVHNADSIMELSRMRQAEWTGAGFGLAALNPPPAAVVSCDADKCSTVLTGERLGLGIVREASSIPQLFGTFEMFPSVGEQIKDSRKVSLTTHYEGGRNTPRSF